MHHQPVELMDGVQGQPHSRFGALLGERGAAGDVETRHVGLQSRGQLRECRFVEILAVLVFCRSLWDEVDLLKKFQASRSRAMRQADTRW